MSVRPLTTHTGACEASVGRCCQIVSLSASVDSDPASAWPKRIRFSSSSIRARAAVASTAAAAASAVASRRFATSWNMNMIVRMNSAGKSATP